MWESFLAALTLILVTELGDKTMILSMIFSAKYRKPFLILPLAILSLSIVTIIGIGFGFLLSSLIPQTLLNYVSGSLFLILGLYYLIAPIRDEKVNFTKTSLASFFVLMFLSEFGDKTQISIISLTISTMAPVSVFIGALIGFAVINFLAVILGASVSARINPVIIRRASAIIFIVFSILTFLQII